MDSPYHPSHPTTTAPHAPRITHRHHRILTSSRSLGTTVSTASNSAISVTNGSDICVESSAISGAKTVDLRISSSWSLRVSQVYGAVGGCMSGGMCDQNCAHFTPRCIAIPLAWPRLALNLQNPYLCCAAL